LAHTHTLTQEHNNQGEAFAYSVEALSHSAPEDHPHGFEPIAERLDQSVIEVSASALVAPKPQTILSIGSLEDDQRAGEEKRDDEHRKAGHLMREAIRGYQRSSEVNKEHLMRWQSSKPSSRDVNSERHSTEEIHL